MNNLNYFKDIYPKIWIEAREGKYSSLKYDLELIKIIENHSFLEFSILELSSGSGDPFQKYFKSKGFKIYGLDIALKSLKYSKKKFNLDNLICADVKQLPIRSNSLDISFSFHSTWYYESLENFMSEALRIMKPGGLLFFDIMNRQNLIVKFYYYFHLIQNKGVGKIIKFLINLIKLMLRKVPDLGYIVHTKPSNPKYIRVSAK